MTEYSAGGSYLVKAENDWWDIVVAYVFNDHFCLAGGYANFGNVLNEQVDGGWALQVKFEL